MRTIAILAFVLAVTRPLAAPAYEVSFVPWKVLNPGDEPLRDRIVLYWIPASRDEIRRSDLVTSRALLGFVAQCVGMQLIRPDDEEMIDKLDAAGQLPIAILVAEGEEVARVEHERGVLSATDVADMVRQELIDRERAAEEMLDAAKTKAASGSTEAAIALYRRVWDERCACPRQARSAQRALKRLGVK